MELEITEELFGPGAADINSMLIKMQNLGIKFSIDDFGKAYSSLSRLKQLPLNTLKIDQSFIQDLELDPDDEVIVRTIITMAHNLNLRVVAEGIETEDVIAPEAVFPLDLVFNRVKKNLLLASNFLISMIHGLTVHQVLKRLTLTFSIHVIIVP